MLLLKKVPSYLRDEETSASSVLFRIAVALLAISVLMLPWLIVLGATLQGQTTVRMWSSTWIGLDCLEIVGLFTTAILLIKRRTYLTIAATFTGTLFLIDAWFDVMLAQSGSAWYGALMSAFFAEIPISLFLFGLAIIAPGLIKDGDRATEQAKQRIRLIKLRTGKIPASLQRGR
jgi:hypothetical protein